MVVAGISLFVALGGTSYAAATGSIDGREIKNSTIQGKDVKNKSLTAKDFKGSVTGKTGKTGSTGPQGPQGAQGVKGDTGPSNIIYDDAGQESLAGGGKELVAAVTLPAGTWHVQAKVVVQDANGGETDCYIQRGATEEDTFYTVLGAAETESLAGAAVVTLGATTAIQLQCNSTGSTSIAAHPFLSATQVGAATAQ
jgi:hypothetical protein